YCISGYKFSSILYINSLHRSSSVERPLPGGENKIGGHRITRNCEALGSFLLTCATTELSLIAIGCLIGATPRGQPWTPAVTLPHGRDGLSAQRMAVLCTFHEPSLCCHVHREFMRNAVVNLTLIIPATTYHQRNYAERYSRFRKGKGSGQDHACGPPARRTAICPLCRDQERAKNRAVAWVRCSRRLLAALCRVQRHHQHLSGITML